MNRNPRVLIGFAVAGFLVLLLASCGDDGGGTAPCTNCGYWDMAYGGIGRFPAVSLDPGVIFPGISPEPDVIAFTSRYQFPEKIEYPFDPGDLGIGDNYHVWLARVEDISDTVWYYQITSDSQDDFLPSWSPGGNLIAFERNIGLEDERQILVVDVSDPENPGAPLQVTDLDLKPPTAGGSPHRNTNPSWSTLDGRTWLSFVSYPLGAGDFDMGLLSWADLSDTVWVSIDPADFAVDENNVMSFMFKDQQSSSNGSGLIAFASPDRQRVGDIEVLASSEEQPDSTVVSEIFINGKPSGKFTPYTFRYRPAGIRVRISGTLEGYCREVGDSLSPLPDTTNKFLIDFMHTRGTLGVSSTGSNLFVLVDGEVQTGPGGLPLKTPGGLDNYVYLTCVMPDETFNVHTEDVFGTLCGDTAEVTVAAGETTFVAFDCDGFRTRSTAAPGGTELKSGLVARGDAGGDAALLTQQEQRGIWIVDTGEEPGIEDDRVYLVDDTSRGSNYPVLSPDGKYVAYFRGEYTSWEIVVADISGLLSGTGEADLTVIGLPGSGEDFECWRKPEKISWAPMQDRARIVVSLSPCRGGVPDEFGIWVADISGFLD